MSIFDGTDDITDETFVAFRQSIERLMSMPPQIAEGPAKDVLGVAVLVAARFFAAAPDEARALSKELYDLCSADLKAGCPEGVWSLRAAVHAIGSELVGPDPVT
jgi:hypothetical protein